MRFLQNNVCKKANKQRCQLTHFHSIYICFGLSLFLKEMTNYCCIFNILYVYMSSKVLVKEINETNKTKTLKEELAFDLN